jgi:hypothetical protein
MSPDGYQPREPSMLAPRRAVDQGFKSRGHDRSVPLDQDSLPFTVRGGLPALPSRLTLGEPQPSVC